MVAVSLKKIFFKQKTAYEIPKRDWSSDVCSSDLNELRRGTPARKSTRGRTPSYSPRQGEAVYAANRANCHRPTQTEKCSNFIEWVGTQIREHKWSLDACCGDAKLHDLFEATEMVCTRTLYNMVWRGDVSIKPTELPEALKRKATKHREMANKRHYGASISTCHLPFAFVVSYGYTHVGW